MPGNGAGAIFVSQYLLQNVTAPTPVANPNTTYGTIGFNDSGGVCGEARNFKQWTFALEQATTSGALSNISVTLYGTVNPAAWQTWWNAIQGRNNYGANPPLAIQGITNAAGYVPGIPPQTWFPLPGPSEQSGTGGIANPITPVTPLLTVNMPLVLVRAVVTAASTPTGTFHVSCTAVP